ncbi:Spo12 family [Geosmithia morbida]|uniref:Spo12 family n=1 Tax=Geosmithia morbida TaxID=1094350 RepID=A0A9P4YQQ3_9HYPO|nr:Spo12 family [Geosmithia morbida]KAF4120822.1 Spo12 family [Geosmithia morbida]
MSSKILSDKDVNAPIVGDGHTADDKDVKSMEYHRQMFQSKMSEPSQQYVSPSDNIMSPCSAKINALRNKHVIKAKPKSLFAQASAKKLGGESALGATVPSKP